MPDRVVIAYDLWVRNGPGRGQAQLAREIGKSQSTVQQLIAEKGKRSIPKTEMLALLAKTLGVSVHWLVTGEGSMAPPGAAAIAAVEQARLEVSYALRMAVAEAVEVALKRAAEGADAVFATERGDGPRGGESRGPA